MQKNVDRMVERAAKKDSQRCTGMIRTINLLQGDNMARWTKRGKIIGHKLQIVWKLSPPSTEVLFLVQDTIPEFMFARLS
jgi:hypothetical protein